VFELWEELREKVFVNYSDATPTLAFVAHARVFSKIQGCRVAGIQSRERKGKWASEQNRADADWDQEQKVGWE
jgi:hypothetical protein